MSLNQILLNTTKRLDIVCDKIDCNEITGGDTLIDNLSIKTQNGDIINLSSLPNKGIGGYRLTSDGDGSVSWAEGAGSAGVDYNGVEPVAIGKLAIYGATNGKLIKDSSLTETDVIDLQTNKLDKDGSIAMTGNLNINNNNIVNVNNLETQSVKATDNLSVNFDNNIELQGNEMKSTKAVDFFFNGDIAHIGVGAGNLEIRGNNCGLNMYSGLNKYAGIGINDGVNNITLNYITNTLDYNLLDINMNGNDITNCDELKVDKLNSSTDTKILINSDLDFQNSYNLKNISLINNIQPSGGLYSESSGFTILSANTSETNLLGQGAFSGSLSIPANSFTALSFYSFKASGVLSGGANDTFTLRALSLTGIPSVVDLGTIVVEITDNGLVDKAWSIVIDFTIRQIGTLGVAFLVLSGYFQYTNNNDVVKTYLRLFKNNTTFSTETSNQLVLEYKNDITNPLTSFTIEQAAFTKWY